MLNKLMALLNQGLEFMPVKLDLEQKDKLVIYVQLLEKWNKTYNLTAIREAEKMMVYHIFDSLSIVDSLNARLNTNAKIIDVGSGGGLPGVVLSILNPSWEVICIDAVKKKTDFINYVANKLKLSNLQAIHNRIENIEPLNADLIISRAFASLLDFTNIAEKHVNNNKLMCAMKAKQLPEELQEFDKSNNWKIDKIQNIVVPNLDAQRCLIWLNSKN